MIGKFCYDNIQFLLQIVSKRYEYIGIKYAIYEVPACGCYGSGLHF